MAYVNPTILEEDWGDLVGWVDGDTNGGVSEIDPAGQLHLDLRAVSSTGQANRGKDIGTIDTGDYYIEYKFKGNPWDGHATASVNRGIGINVQAGTNWLIPRIMNGHTDGDGIWVYDGATYNKVLAKTWDNEWHTIVFYVHNSQTDVDIWVDKHPSETADVTDADCSHAKVTDGLVGVTGYGSTDGDGEYHIDYLYIGEELLPQAYTMTVTVGAFVLTGIDAGLGKSYEIVTNVGTFILTGIDAILEAFIQWINATKHNVDVTNQSKS